MGAVGRGVAAEARAAPMGLFLSTVINRIDAKGRTSVPAKFRAALADEGAMGVVVFPSFTHACLEAMTMEKVVAIADRLEGQFNPFDDEGDAFAQSILAACMELPFDREGRIMLPGGLCDHAGIDAEAAFVGLGRRFQIWDPETYAAYAAEARALARDRRAKFGPGAAPAPASDKAAIPAGHDGTPRAGLAPGGPSGDRRQGPRNPGGGA
ncbi:MAG: division/cell wall cluster transcriptional repressor MraZ [Alphaproteobacteria bacterium]